MPSCPICNSEMIKDKEDNKYFCEYCKNRKYSVNELFWRDMI